VTGIRASLLFFDDEAVTRRVDAAARRVLSKFGAYVRTAARHSIRKRRKVSAPGKPPSSHVGDLRRLIFFAYEPRTKNVVIGPAAFGAGVAPALLEQEHVAGTTRLVAKRDRRGRLRRMRYRARPFMGPAFEHESPKLPAMWAGSVRG